MFMLFCAFSPTEVIGQEALEASFTYTPVDPVVDETIRFDASGSVGEGIHYSWNMGDGHLKYGKIINYSYALADSYTVVLTVTNSTGSTDSEIKTVEVEEEPNPAGVFVGILGLGFFGIYMLVYFFVIFLMMLVYASNPIVGGILAYKMYSRAKEHGELETAKPFLFAHLIAGVVSIFMYFLAFFSTIAHIVIYMIFKGKMEEKGIDIGKKKEGASTDETSQTSSSRPVQQSSSQPSQQPISPITQRQPSMKSPRERSVQPTQQPSAQSSQQLCFQSTQKAPSQPFTTLPQSSAGQTQQSPAQPVQQPHLQPPKQNSGQPSKKQVQQVNPPECYGRKSHPPTGSIPGGDSQPASPPQQQLSNNPSNPPPKIEPSDNTSSTSI